MPPTPTPPPRRVGWRQLRASAKLTILALALLVLLAGLEGIARLYWGRVKGVAPVTAEAVWRSIYREVGPSGIDAVAPY